MKPWITWLAVTTYACGAIFTFGLAYNRSECPRWVGSDYCPDIKGSGAILAAMVWPLSLSAIAQENSGAGNER